MTDHKIIDYKLVVLGTADALTSKISEMIRAGWQPYGHPGTPLVIAYLPQAPNRSEVTRP